MKPTSGQSIAESPIRIDIGCGSNKRQGFIGLDNKAAPGVDHVLDLVKDRLPFDDGTVDHVFSAHFLEHVKAPPHLLQEIARVCKDGAKIEFWTPYAFSSEAFLYGHETFLTELHWMHFCCEHRDDHLGILGGRWLLHNINYVVSPETEAEVIGHGFSVDFAIRYLKSVVLEFGVEIEFRRALSTPPVRPRRTYSYSRYSQRFVLQGTPPNASPSALGSRFSFGRFTRHLRDLLRRPKEITRDPFPFEGIDCPPNSLLEKEFERRKPWITKFTIDGREYGGQFDPSEDARIKQFFEWFPDPKEILEFGALEGGHTFRLIAHPTVERVLAIEARPANIEKAVFVQQTLCLRNIEFLCANLETIDLTTLGKFDALFCSGVLYHLPEPWKLISQFPTVSANLFIWTHYAHEHEANRTINGYRGKTFKESGLADPLSGLSKESFWPTLSALKRMLTINGYETIHILDNDPNHPHGPCVTMVVSRSRS